METPIDGDELGATLDRMAALAEGCSHVLIDDGAPRHLVRHAQGRVDSVLLYATGDLDELNAQLHEVAKGRRTAVLVVGILPRMNATAIDAYVRLLARVCARYAARVLIHDPPPPMLRCNGHGARDPL